MLIHPYGPHIFHTNSQDIFDYLSRFTAWRPYQHRVLASVDGQLVPMPINLDTVNKLYGLDLTEAEAEEFFRSQAEPVAHVKTSEDAVVSKIGRDLYEKFFKNYTRKQWQRDPAQLDASVCGRIPVRTNRDDRFVSDKFQALPKDGYTAMFGRMLAHPKIEVRLNTDYREARKDVQFRHLIYTGPVDEYFDHCFGALPYRSIRFEEETLPVEYHQPAMQVNFPNDHAYTRVVEMKHATGQKLPVTTIVREFPQDYGPGHEPYYPIPAPDARAQYERYAVLAAQAKDVTFVGRLATYRYYNMDQVVGTALAEFERLKSLSASISTSGRGASTT